MAYTTSVRVRFGDEDHAQIVYYPRFFNFFHIAFEDFFNDQGFPYQDVIDVDGIGFPTVHLEADFKQTLKFGDQFDIEVGVLEVGKSSVVFQYIGRKRGALAAHARMTVVCVDMKSFRPVALPDRFRTLFERNRVDPLVPPPVGRR